MQSKPDSSLRAQLPLQIGSFIKTLLHPVQFCYEKGRGPLYTHIRRTPSESMSGDGALSIQERAADVRQVDQRGAITTVNSVSIFWMQLFASVFVLSVVTAWYVWPALTRHSRNSALALLLFVHVPRYVGMILLVPGMVDPTLPREFLFNAAYGDLVEAVLALACIFALRSNWRIAIPMVWVTNIWGFLDLLNGLRGLVQLNIPSFNLATFWYVYTYYAPLVLVSHVLIFWILIKSKSWER